MIVTLPTKNGNIDFNLDMSAYAEYRYEVNYDEFKHIRTPKIGFFDYAASVTKTKSPQYDLLKMLTVLYCLLESDKVPTFKNFLQLFDAGNAEKIGEILNEVIPKIKNNAIKNSNGTSHD